MKSGHAADAAHAAGFPINRHTRTHMRAYEVDTENPPHPPHVPQPRPNPLTDLAQQVARLCPDRRDPERFHIEKSEIVAALRRLAREIAA